MFLCITSPNAIKKCFLKIINQITSNSISFLTVYYHFKSSTETSNPLANPEVQTGLRSAILCWSRNSRSRQRRFCHHQPQTIFCHFRQKRERAERRVYSSRSKRMLSCLRKLLTKAVSLFGLQGRAGSMCNICFVLRITDEFTLGTKSRNKTRNLSEGLVSWTVLCKRKKLLVLSFYRFQSREQEVILLKALPSKMPFIFLLHLLHREECHVWVSLPDLKNTDNIPSHDTHLPLTGNVPFSPVYVGVQHSQMAAGVWSFSILFYFLSLKDRKHLLITMLYKIYTITYTTGE